MLSLSFVTGTEPGKWFERFKQRTQHGGFEALSSDDALGTLLSEEVTLALTRLPDKRIDDSFHVVELYREDKGIALPKESDLVELVDGQLVRADFLEEIVNYEIPSSGEVDPAAVRDALQIVAANVGVAIAPLPLIKVLSKKLVVSRELQDDKVPYTFIALVWKKNNDSDVIQDFVGIAKGRTVNSSRLAAPKRSAREKALAKQARKYSGGKPRKRR